MEEKKEKKTIKCSYAVLVIILFAALAFVTDYAFIERKTKNCDCPTCEATKNEEISDNTDKTQVNEEKIYTNADVSGLYSKTFNLEKDESGNIMNVYYHLYLAEDGTFVYDAAWYIGFSYIGNYYIDGDKIILNFLFKGGHEPIFSRYYGTSTLTISSNNEIIDNNIFMYSDKIGTNEVILTRENDVSEETMNKFKTKFKTIIEVSDYINERVNSENE